jgi:flap endonuclease-1
MGTKGLMSFCKKCFPEAFEQKTFEDYRTKSMVVDTLQKLYNYGIAIRKSGSDKTNLYNESVSHLYATMQYTRFLVKNEIKPIYVLDGKAPTIKHDVLQKRRNIKHNAMEQCELISDKTSPEHIKYYKRCFALNENQVQECIELLTAFGIPYVRAQGEADPQCAALVFYNNNSNIYGAISDDSDLLAFGAQRIVKNFSGKHPIVTEISLPKLLLALFNKANEIRHVHGLSKLAEFRHEDLVNLMIIFGSSYNPAIAISHEHLFSYFVQCNLNVERLVNFLESDDYQKKRSNIVPENFIDKWKAAYKYYMDAEVIAPKSINVELKKPDRNKIIQILCDRCSFSRRDVSKLVDELEHFYYENRDKNALINLTGHDDPIHPTHPTHPIHSVHSDNRSNPIDREINSYNPNDKVRQTKPFERMKRAFLPYKQNQLIPTQILHRQLTTTKPKTEFIDTNTNSRRCLTPTMVTRLTPLLFEKLGIICPRTINICDTHILDQL